MEETLKKYLLDKGLPEYQFLEDNFEISSISEDENIGKGLLRKVFNHVDFYVSLFEDLIQPDSSLSSMQEASNLSPAERVLINNLHSKFMYISRSVWLLNLDYSEEKAIIFLNKFFKDWLVLKDDIRPILMTMQTTWNGTFKIKKTEGYFG